MIHVRIIFEIMNKIFSKNLSSEKECLRRGDKSDNEVTKVTKVTLGDNTI